MQQISFVVRRGGKESMNRGIPDRYQHYRDKDVSKIEFWSRYHLVISHHGNEVLEIQHYVHPKRHSKRKCDDNAL